MWSIKDLKLKNNIVLAPMAGISNPAYMRICEKFGVGLVFTELISAEAITRGNDKTYEMLNGIDELNIPYGIQLFGSNSEVLSKATKIVLSKFKPSLIDINMGCPVHKVISTGSGSALLKEPDKIGKIVESVVHASTVPVTVKIRSGWDEASINAPFVARICEDAGASAISVHARTRTQGYSGKADWNIIKEVKESVSIPVIGNGDILTCYDAKRMIDETGCDAVMIGRGALGNPWLIKECIDYLKDGTLPKTIPLEDKIKVLKEHYSNLIKDKGEKLASLEIRSNALWYVKGMPNAAVLKNQICKSKSSEELFNILDEYIKNIE